MINWPAARRAAAKRPTRGTTNAKRPLKRRKLCLAILARESSPSRWAFKRTTNDGLLVNRPPTHGATDLHTRYCKLGNHGAQKGSSSANYDGP